MKPKRKRPPPCRCEAYPFPHRLRYGNCRYPDGPANSEPGGMDAVYKRETQGIR